MENLLNAILVQNLYEINQIWRYKIDLHSIQQNVKIYQDRKSIIVVLYYFYTKT